MPGFGVVAERLGERAAAHRHGRQRLARVRRHARPSRATRAPPARRDASRRATRRQACTVPCGVDVGAGDDGDHLLAPSRSSTPSGSCAACRDAAECVGVRLRDVGGRARSAMRRAAAVGIGCDGATPDRRRGRTIRGRGAAARVDGIRSADAARPASRCSRRAAAHRGRDGNEADGRRAPVHPVTLGSAGADEDARVPVRQQPAHDRREPALTGMATQPAVGPVPGGYTCRKNALPAPWRTPPGALRVL